METAISFKVGKDGEHVIFDKGVWKLRYKNVFLRNLELHETQLITGALQFKQTQTSC